MMCFHLAPLKSLELWNERFDSQIHYLVDLDLFWIYNIRLTILIQLCISEDRAFQVLTGNCRHFR